MENDGPPSQFQFQFLEEVMTVRDCGLLLGPGLE